MQIRDLLELPLIRAAGARVVAGEESLGRDVRWVHTGEIADIASFLSGGEVLLTAATGLSDDVRSRRRYVRELVEVGIAALIVELGRSITRIPPEMIEEADRGNLVLVTLDREVPFIEVTYFVHTQLVSAAHSALVRAIEIDHALSRLILDGAPLVAVLETLADLVRNPVILEDTAHRVVAFGRASGAAAPILRSWQTHARSAHPGAPDSSVHDAPTEPPCAWVEITLRGEAWGRLHLLALDHPLDDVARLALGRAATSIALLLLAERERYLSETAESALIRAVSSPADFNGDEFIDRAVALGVALDGELVLLATGPSPGAAEDASRALPELAQAMRAAFAAESWPVVVGTIDDVVAAVGSADVAGGYEQRAVEVARRVSADLAAPAHFGVSRRCGAAALPRAFHEARTAHRLSRREQASTVQLYDRLALHRLLAPLVSGPGLATFVEGELGDLIAYDAGHSSDLVRTLDAFLQANGNKEAMAGLLHLRRRSVYYRLERIEQVLGASLDEPDRRARLYVAMRARELLNDAPGSHA